MRLITERETREYRDHGVVHLPDFLDEDWLRRMEVAFTEEMFAESADLKHVDIAEGARMMEAMGAPMLTPGADSATGRFWVRTFNWRRFPAVAELGCQPPMPAAIAALLGATRLNFYGEQLFFKEAGSVHRTAFHQDAPYFHLSGDQCCTIWMPLDVVDADNGDDGLRARFPPVGHTRSQQFRESGAAARFPAVGPS